MCPTLPPSDAEPAPAVRCGLCGLPVARSAGDAPVLIHLPVAAHGSPGRGAVDVFFSPGPCPQEGAVVPAEHLGVIPVLEVAAAHR